MIAELQPSLEEMVIGWVDVYATCGLRLRQFALHNNIKFTNITPQTYDQNFEVCL